MNTSREVRYHWIITIQREGQLSLRTREGVIGHYPGTTRQKMYYRICDELREPGPYAVLFFSMEPDEL